MSERLEGKCFIVVGAGTGIGAATVKRLASEGAKVCVADINGDAARGVAEQVLSHGGSAFAVTVDITDADSVKAAFDEAVARLGRLDGAHINAADLRVIFEDSNAIDIDMAVFDRTIDVNLRGHLRCAKEALPHLLANGGGALIFTTSDAGDAGEPVRPSYATSKSGLNALMRHIASRWGRESITSNCVAPGFVMTPEMIAGGQVPKEVLEEFSRATPAPRVGKVEDIAAMVALLLSEDGRWVNGQVIHVDGGAIMK
ncbi:oxidoreductase [Croceicoccus estronivorus]|uniref:SDR family NAD(P)-dependent oxidoreductase n=1 Tax=Croceicoccus estronivorus TaxID=1172626 RepID=UPI000829DF17|nr:SDR family NAD(P)-dependent oxidoreductase [Croceicoccus estronivorus]OCC22601.1 oxidoreductase [Croceicoccus estronivorus]